MGVVFKSQHSMTICWLSEGRPCWLGAWAEVSIIRSDGAESPGLVLGDCHVGQGAMTGLVSKSLVCSAHMHISGQHCVEVGAYSMTTSNRHGHQCGECRGQDFLVHCLGTHGCFVYYVLPNTYAHAAAWQHAHAIVYLGRVMLATWSILLPSIHDADE